LNVLKQRRKQKKSYPSTSWKEWPPKWKRSKEKNQMVKTRITTMIMIMTRRNIVPTISSNHTLLMTTKRFKQKRMMLVLNLVKNKLKWKKKTQRGTNLSGRI
jgi:hypothetical protein